MTTLPSFEASGHPSPGLVPNCSLLYWADEQVPMPSAAEGLMLTPSGSATTTFRGSVSAIPPGDSRPWFGSFRVKSSPEGLVASLLVGCEATSGEKGTASQPASEVGVS